MCHFLVILNGFFTNAEMLTENGRRLLLIMDFKTQLVIPFSTVFDTTCLGLDENISVIDIHYREVMLLALLPFALFVLAAFFGVVTAGRCKCKQFMRGTMAAFSAAMFLALPSIMLGLIQEATCINSISATDDSLVRRLKYFPEIDCDSDDYKQSLYWFVLPGIGVWLALYPLISLLLMTLRFLKIYHPSKIGEDQEERALKESKS